MSKLPPPARRLLRMDAYLVAHANELHPVATEIASEANEFNTRISNIVVREIGGLQKFNSRPCPPLLGPLCLPCDLTLLYYISYIFVKSSFACSSCWHPSVRFFDVGLSDESPSFAKPLSLHSFAFKLKCGCIVLVFYFSFISLVPLRSRRDVGHFLRFVVDLVQSSFSAKYRYSFLFRAQKIFSFLDLVNHFSSRCIARFQSL